MHDDVDAAESIANRARHERAAVGGGHVRRDEQIGVLEVGRRRSSGGENPHSELAQSSDHRRADSLRAARDERPLSV